MVESVTNMFSSDEAGQTNALELLKADHDKVDTLFQKVKANEDGDNSDTFDQIRRELVVHTHIEETIFYPFLLSKGDEELQKITREGIEEHRQVKMFLEELQSMSSGREAFPAKLQVLMEDVTHHVQEEEGEMFPMVSDQFDEKRLNELGAQLKAEKERSMGKATRSVSA